MCWAEVGGGWQKIGFNTNHSMSSHKRGCWAEAAKSNPQQYGSNTQFSGSVLKQQAPNYLCPPKMADPPAPALYICEHICNNGAGISKSARLRSATALRMCECTFNQFFSHAKLVIWIINDYLYKMYPHINLRFMWN